MRFLFVTALAAMALSLGAAAQAQPSYPCNVRLNPTEKAICTNAELADLDLAMANKFHAIADRMTPAQQDAFWQQQTQWRHDRDACGPAVGCIRASYVYRIGQFDAMTGVSAAAACPAPAGPSRTFSSQVLPDGTIERLNPDGSRERHLPNGEIVRYGPDGREMERSASGSLLTERLRGQSIQIVRLTPPLPEYQTWTTSLENSLAAILENILTDAEYQYYRTTEANKADYDLIDWRLRSIRVLTQQ